MTETEVTVHCYWNGCIKNGPDGVYYEGSTPKVIKVKQTTKFTSLLDQLFLLTGFDKQRSKFGIIGRYPSAVQNFKVKYIPLPVVDDTNLEIILAVPSNHPSINSVELYLELEATSADVICHPSACLLSLANASTSSKRQRTTNVSPPPVKLEVNGGLPDVIVLSEDKGISDKDLNQDVPKPCMSSLWLDDHDLRVGLCFKDSDELEKAVDWCSFKGQRKCVARETSKDDYSIFECIRWNCKWSLEAVRLEKHRLFEITKYTGPHTCRPADPKVFKSEFEVDEIERLVRIQPTQSVSELKKWWGEKIGYEIETSKVRVAKEEAIKKVFGDWEQSFEDFPKLMSAFCSSNGLLVDWKYDLFPNTEFASFSAVFWAFPQSIEGFQYCRPLIVVDTKDLGGEYQLKLMIASGVDAANKYFPLAFAVTKEVSSDSWRWFLTEIREKVTQREGLCLISGPHPDILAVVNEPESQWQEPLAYHRFCVNHLCSQLSLHFPSFYLECLVKRAGYTDAKEEFDSYMKKIQKDYPEARKWLDQFRPHKWSLVHDTGLRYGIMRIDTEDLFEVCRGFKPADHVVTGSVLILFDELRSSFNESFRSSRSSLNCGYKYTEPVEEKLEEFRTSSVTCTVMPLDNNAFKVTTPSQKDEWTVRLNDSTCTCGEFQRCKFPCLHALAVCKKLKMNPLQYVDGCYSLKRFNKTYAATFYPVPEISAWPEASGVPRLFSPVIPPPPPPPPPSANGAGKSRRKITKTKKLESYIV